jgi:hypothetical protein
MRLGPLLLLFVSLSLFSCSPATSLPATRPADGSYPLDTKTGIQEVDRVLAAVAGGDAGNLASLIHFTTAPCTTADGLGGPPKCREGEPEGTLVDGLPFISSEGGYIRKEDMTNSNAFNLREDALYAIYRVSENALNEEYYPPGDYMIVFMPDENGSATALRVDKVGIVRVDTLFGDSLKTVIERDAAEVILPPGKR